MKFTLTNVDSEGELLPSTRRTLTIEGESSLVDEILQAATKLKADRDKAAAATAAKYWIDIEPKYGVGSYGIGYPGSLCSPARSSIWGLR